MLAALAIAFTFMGMASEAEIRPEIVELKEFSVAGIEARTSNAKEMIGGGAIPKQWDRFFKEGILQKIPHKVEPYIFVVYTDYAGDRNGEYTYLIGAKVSDGSAAPLAWW
jgi:predicted transcriptional regulator YdeE